MSDVTPEQITASAPGRTYGMLALRREDETGT